MRLSLIASLLLHVFLVLGFQKAFPWYWPGQELRTYRVELIRPPVEDLSMEDLSDRDLTDIMDEESRSPAEDQDTISLDTDDVRYVTYARLVKERIMAEWRYPAEARENLIEGSLLVVFGLERDGRMTGIDILGTSGYEILDQEALRALRRAAPFPPFPDHITVSRLNIKAAFDYRIAAHR